MGMQGNQGDIKQQNRLLAEHVRLARKADRRAGCLLGLLWTLLFGVFYWAWLGIKWTGKLAWKSGAVAWAACVAGSVWTWRSGVWSARQGVALARVAIERISNARHHAA